MRATFHPISSEVLHAQIDIRTCTSFLAAIVWLGSQLNQPHAAEQEKPAAQKWEYQISWGLGPDGAAVLNKLGD